MPVMGDYDPEVRAYLACTPPSAPGYAPGAVTMLFINQDTENKSIALYQGARLGEATAAMATTGAARSPWGPTPPPFDQLPRTEFILSAPGSDVLSREIELNGVTMKMAGGTTLPTLAGRKGEADEMVVPQLSYGFAVYTAAKAQACMKR